MTVMTHLEFLEEKKITACLFKNICQSLFLHKAVILNALKLVEVPTFFLIFFSTFFSEEEGINNNTNHI